MYQLDHLPGRSLQLNGEEWLYFSGTAYLGIPHHPQFRAHLSKGMEKYGSNFGGSRRSNLQLKIFEEAESFLANWTGTEAALTISSGSLAGQLLVNFLSHRYNLLVSPTAHPALWPNEELPPINFQSWTDSLPTYITQIDQPAALLLSSIDPLLAEAYEWDWIENLPKDRKTVVVVDDSHGFGVLGENGEGIISSLPVFNHVEYIIVTSMGKALGIPGGVILGKKDFIDGLWDSPYFGGASPIIPAYLYAFVQSQDVYETALKRLKELIAKFQNYPVVRTNFRFIPGYPVHYCLNQSLLSKFEENKIAISSFRYPSSYDPMVSRVILSAVHQDEDLEYLIGKIN